MRAMSTLLADVRFTLRNLRRSPGVLALVLASVGVYRPGPGRPMVLGGSALALAVIGLLASWWPAFRASRIDPQVAMRDA
jgi:ABC-type antimicrobial peptide transport system permease subunit